MKLRKTIAVITVVVTVVSLALAAEPVVSNVRAAQRLGTPYVDITYDLADVDTATLDVTVAVSTNGGAVYFTPAAGLSGDLGGSVTRGTGRKIAWNAGAALPPRLFNNVRVQVAANNSPASFLSVSINPIGGSFVVNRQHTWFSMVNGGAPPYTYLWTGSNGNGNAPFSSTNVNFDAIFQTLGPRRFTLTVTDSQGAVSISSTNFITIFLGPMS